MPGRGRPCPRQIVKRIPMDSRNATNKQFRCSTQTKFLNFFRAEAAYTNFGNPYRQISDSLNLTDSIRPFVDRPVIPIQRETMESDHFEVIEYAEALHARNEFGIDWRNPAEDPRHVWIHFCNRICRRDRHVRKHSPFRVNFEIPVGFVVGFIPNHHCFNHSSSFPCSARTRAHLETTPGFILIEEDDDDQNDPSLISFLNLRYPSLNRGFASL